MSARKLSRLAGLVLVLAAVFGGTSAAFGAEHTTGGSITDFGGVLSSETSETDAPITTFDWQWT